MMCGQFMDFYVTPVVCKACSGLTPRISARCRACNAERTHKDCYPEQYAHPLVGKRVRVNEGEAEGVVVRVVGTRYGPLAHLDTGPQDLAYLLSDCEVVP